MALKGIMEVCMNELLEILVAKLSKIKVHVPYIWYFDHPAIVWLALFTKNKSKRSVIIQ